MDLSGSALGRQVVFDATATHEWDGPAFLVEACLTDGSAARIVALIQQLYQAEHAAADLTPEARQVSRRGQVVALLAQIDAVRQDLARTALKSPWRCVSRISRGWST